MSVDAEYQTCVYGDGRPAVYDGRCAECHQEDLEMADENGTYP